MSPSESEGVRTHRTGFTLWIGQRVCVQRRGSLSGSEGTCAHSAGFLSQDQRAHVHTVQGVHLFLELPPCVLEAGCLAVTWGSPPKLGWPVSPRAFPHSLSAGITSACHHACFCLFVCLFYLSPGNLTQVSMLRWQIFPWLSCHLPALPVCILCSGMSTGQRTALC